MGQRPSNLNSILDQLLHLLRQETELYESMLQAMVPEKQALLAADESALRRASRQKESILLKLKGLETRRCAVTAELADGLGYDRPELTLEEIARQVGEPHAGALKQAGDVLKKLLKTLAEENRRQKEIFEHSLAIMRSAFELLHSVTAAPTVYRRSGSVRKARSTGNFVYNEA